LESPVAPAPADICLRTNRLAHLRRAIGFEPGASVRAEAVQLGHHLLRFRRKVTKVTSLSVRARAWTGMESCKVVGMGKRRRHAAKPSTSIPIRKAKSERQPNGFFRPRIDIRKPTSPRKVELDIAAAPRLGEAADDLQQGFGPEQLVKRVEAVRERAVEAEAEAV